LTAVGNVISAVMKITGMMKNEYFEGYCLIQKMKPKFVFICSKYKGNIKENTERAKKFSREVLDQGHIPFTPHIYFPLFFDYPQFLDESKEEKRNESINAGLEWMKLCDEVWVYDNPASEGMKKELEFARKLGKKVVMKK